MRKNSHKNIKIPNFHSLNILLKSDKQGLNHSLTRELYRHIPREKKQEIIDKINKLFQE